MPEEQATYHTPHSDMPHTTVTPRTAESTLQIIQDIAEQAIQDKEDLEGALLQIHHEAGHPVASDHPHTDFHALAKRTIRWAQDKGIHDEGTPEGQADKLLEEAIETWAAVRGLSDADAEELQEHAEIIVGRTGVPGDYDKDAAVRDGMGDVLVTLINTAYAYLCIAGGQGGPSYAAVWLMLCWDEVLDEIEDRDGEMQDGMFVKSDDL